MKSTIPRAVAPVLMVTVLGMGCGTSYRPQERGRISLVLTGQGEEALEKDGKRYKIGGFSEELVEAVKGHAAAEEHARTYQHQRNMGTGLAILGATGLLVGYLSFAFLVGPYDSTAEGGGPSPAARRTLMITMSSGLLVGLASMFGAGRYSQQGQAHLLDAINIYNADASRGQGR
jgi:hypothetical protein